MHALHWPRTLSHSRRVGAPSLALFAFGSWANAEHASAEPEPMLSLSMTILANSSDLGQMKGLKVR